MSAMMGNRRRIQRLTAGLILAGAISHTNAQEQTTGSDVSATPTQSISRSDVPSTTSSISGSESSSTDVPLELWGIANGLLSSYYPSTTISNVASLTWPSVVVIRSSTYTRDPPSTLPTTSPATSPSTLATSAISSQDVSRPLATDSSNDAEQTDVPEDPEPTSGGQPKDRTLGIALGVVFGVLALGLMAFALLCIHHRQKKHGGTGLFPSRRRRAGSPTDSEIGAWRARHPHMSLVANAASGRPMTQIRDDGDNDNLPPREWVKRYNRLADQQTPPAHLHPAFMHRHNDSVGTTSESNPFFPPADHHHQASPQPNIGASSYNNESNEYHPGYPKLQPGFNNVITAYKHEEEPRRSQSPHNNERRRSSFSSERSDGDVDLERNSRPPTPFSPMMMLQTSLPPFQRQNHLQSSTSPSHPQAQHHSRDTSNPFTSPSDPEEQRQQYQTLIPSHPHETYHPEDDDEDDDIVHPMLQHPQPQPPPSRSPARRHSPLVHYPSWSEVSEFDFTGESSSSLSREQQQQQQRQNRRKSGGNGGEGDRDGYGRDRESVVGRWELA